MRVIVGSPESHPRWLPEHLGKHEIKSLTRALRDQVILAATGQGFRQLLNQASAVQADPHLKAQLADIVSVVPLTFDPLKPPVDLLLQELSGDRDASLLDAILADDFDAICRERRRSVLRNTPRQEVFDRHILPYAAAASSVSLLDQYLFTSICQGRAEGIFWFINQLISCKVGQLTLLSCLPRSEDLPLLKERIVEAVGYNSPGSAASTPLQIHVRAALHDPKAKKHGGDGLLTHDRHIRFSLGKSGNRITPVMDIGPGFDIFRRPSVQDDFNLVESPDRRAAISRENWLTAQPGLSSLISLGRGHRRGKLF